MKRTRILFSALLFVTLIIISHISVTAHSGDTDWKGGHFDNSTGEYHYHHGYPAHDHYDMDGDGDIDCPYDFDDQTDVYDENYSTDSNEHEIKNNSSDKKININISDSFGFALFCGLAASVLMWLIALLLFFFVNSDNVFMEFIARIFEDGLLTALGVIAFFTILTTVFVFFLYISVQLLILTNYELRAILALLTFWVPICTLICFAFKKQIIKLWNIIKEAICGALPIFLLFIVPILLAFIVALIFGKL